MKRLLVVIAMILFVALLLNMSRFGVINDTSELTKAQAVLIQEARALNREAEMREACAWREVATDYLSDYDLGRLDGMYAETVRLYKHEREPNSWEPNSYGSFSNGVASAIWYTVQERLVKTGEDPIAPEKIKAVLDEDHRIKFLHELAKADREVFNCRRNAAETNSMMELRQVQENFDAKKRNLVRLIKTSS